MQTSPLSKNNEMNKIKQWFCELDIKEKTKLLQVDANLVIRQLQLSKIQKNSDCACDICKGNISTTPKIISNVVRGSKTEFTLNLNIDKNRISLDEEFLKEDSQIFDVVKRINSIFIDDFNVPVHELPSPNDTRMMYYKKCINIQHLFKSHYDSHTDKQSGKLLFQIYLARLFSHYIINAYKTKLAFDNEKDLLKTEEAKKNKKKAKKNKRVKLSIETEKQKPEADTQTPKTSVPLLDNFTSSWSDEEIDSENDEWSTVSPKKQSRHNDDLSYGSEEYSPEKKNHSPKQCTSPIGHELKKNLDLNYFNTTPFTFTSLHSVLYV